MNRKTFLKRTGLGLGLAMVPGIVISQVDPIISGIVPKVIRQGKGPVLNVIGDIQTHKIMGTETGNQVFEWVNNVAPGVGIPAHIHTREDEIFRVLKGQVEMTIGDNTTVLQAGDIAYAPKNVAHSWTVVGAEEASMSVSAFPAGIERMFKALSELPPGEPDFDTVSQICAEYGVSFV